MKKYTQEEFAQHLVNNGLQLGGSRRMAQKYPNQIKITDETDYDFYCDDFQVFRRFLEDEGFEKVMATNRSYWDDLLEDMYTHPTMRFEVLIRKDAVIYRSVFESLSAEVYIQRLWKSSPEIMRAHRYNMQSSFWFKPRVCHYFNTLFRLHGWVDDSLPPVPEPETKE